MVTEKLFYTKVMILLVCSFDLNHDAEVFVFIFTSLYVTTVDVTAFDYNYLQYQGLPRDYRNCDMKP